MAGNFRSVFLARPQLTARGGQSLLSHRWCCLAAGLMGVAAWAAAVPGGELYILQDNDVDPTAPSSQVGGRWYHWMGVDPVVTHLETGMAIDAGAYRGVGQRIDVPRPAALWAIEIKLKRIGWPGPLVWQAGSAPGKDDLGSGQVPAERVSGQYEHFVRLRLEPRRPPAIYLKLGAITGQCPQDYYAAYCTWRTNDPRKARIDCYTGTSEVGMMYRALRADPRGAALAANGKPMSQGASMMSRLLTTEPGPGRRKLLPDEEEPFQFVERLAAGEDPRHAGLPWTTLAAGPGEIALGPDWRIRVAAPRSPQVVTAVDDLAGFLRRRMKLPLPVAWGAAPPEPRTITLTQGKQMPGGPVVPAGYRYEAGPQGIRIHGYDPCGVLRGVWYLEDLLMLRGGPLLAPDARTREPRYWPRATCAAWGGTGEACTPTPVYTDGHLSLVSHYGYDAIWLNWYPGPDRGPPPTEIPPGRVPRGTGYRPFTSQLRDLVERAERYGLEVVILYAAPHPRDERERQALRDEARQFLRDLPKLRTIVLLDEGMGSMAHGLDAWLNTCSLLTRAFSEVRPGVRVAAWRYSFAARTPDRREWDSIVGRFSAAEPRLGYMADFDTFWARRRDGRLQQAYDYCLSLQFPSDDYRHAVEFLVRDARQKHCPLRPIWAKIETRFSQEANTQPEIPCMQRWAERFQALGAFRPPILGTVANWYHQGFYPTPVTELFGWLSYTNPPPVDELLRAIARRDFGPGQEDRVLAAWADFSEALWHFPFYFGLSYPMNAGLAQPFWLDAAARNPRPWRRGFVNSLDALDLSDHATAGGNGPENRQRLAQFNALWQRGLARLRGAVGAAPAAVRPRAEDNWRTAQSIGDKSAMTLRLVRWLDARGRLAAAHTRAESSQALDALEKIGREELAADRAAVPMYLRDSRLGHLNHGRGCFTAMSILTKIQALEKTLHEEIPAAREDKSRAEAQ
jgi:hypothetical protein